MSQKRKHDGTEQNEKIRIIKKCSDRQQGIEDENKFYTEDDDDAIEAGKLNGCSFWLGKGTIHCSEVLFEGLVATYNRRKHDLKYSIVSTFIASLVKSGIDQSYQSFKKEVHTFAEKNKYDVSYVFKSIHDNYDRQDGFIAYIGADDLLWYLTHPDIWKERDSGPSIVIQSVCNAFAFHPRLNGVDRALRMFMNEPYNYSLHQPKFVQYWTSTELVFGDKFNRSIPKNVLPNGLTKVTFGNDYESIGLNQDKFLPDDVQELVFLGKSTIREDKLPLQLTKLSAPKGTLKSSSTPNGTLSMTPPGLKSLNIGTTVTILPDGLEEFVLHEFNPTISLDDILPHGLKRLELWNYPLPIVLPSSLHELVLHNFKGSLDEHTLPSGLKRLELTEFNQYLNKALPSGLEVLVMPMYEFHF